VSAPLQGLGFSAWGECFLLQQQGLTPDQSSWEGTNKAALAARSSQAKLAKTAVALRTAVPKSKASQALSNDHQGILHKWKKNPKPAVSILQNQQSSNFNFFLTWKIYHFEGQRHQSLCKLCLSADFFNTLIPRTPATSAVHSL